MQGAVVLVLQYVKNDGRMQPVNSQIILSRMFAGLSATQLSHADERPLSLNEDNSSQTGFRRPEGDAESAQYAGSRRSFR